ncbi:hypothetical protein N0V95_007950 [Ascochyta clinopodiicola]|nr:hypothetical protein N0V95_007950 [Ascochyta clinopodiicola]
MLYSETSPQDAPGPLKPLGKTGLFSKGKASTTARGSGLPDLVFSKMGFLQNNRVENEHSAQVPDAKKKRKRDHTQTKEGDISAFFTSPLNFSGPGLYAQQEQRQHLLMPFGSEEEYRAQDLNTVGRGYKGESGFSIQEDVERFSEEPVSYGSMEESNADGGVVGLDRVVDEVEQVQRLGSVDFVASGFWRPNRLY